MENRKQPVNGLPDDGRVRALIQIAQAGDAEARSRLTRENTRLVTSIVARFFRGRDNPEDLFQVGCIGLMKAVDGFDCAYNVRFSTYAYPKIMGEIRAYLRSSGAIHVSRSLREDAARALKIYDLLILESGREPKIEEIARRADMRPEDVLCAMDAVREPLSLNDSPGGEWAGEETSLIDAVADKRVSEDNWVRDLSIRQAFTRLSRDEKCVIMGRYFEKRTQSEIGRRLGRTQVQVSRLEKQALTRMRRFLDGDPPEKPKTSRIKCKRQSPPSKKE